MDTNRKMNIEELKKSFPALDNYSNVKLLGGGPGDYWDPFWNSGGGTGSHDFVMMTQVQFPNDSFIWSVLSQSGGTGGNGGGGGVYFGDSDDSYGDMGDAGWGDGGFGDGDLEGGGVGGYSNPGGSEVSDDNGRMTFPSFSILWSNYPPEVDGAPAHPSVDSYPNQCAIRVGYALQQSGVDISSYPEVNQTTDGYPRSAQGLADWIWQNFGPPTKIPIEDFQNDYSGQTGLIFEHNISGSTPHIDLWNEGSTGSGFFVGGIDEVWFWPIN